MWIAEELLGTSWEINGVSVAPPTWIVEDHITGGISLASKNVHHLPTVSWWLGPATSLIRYDFSIILNIVIKPGMQPNRE